MPTFLLNWSAKVWNWSSFMRDQHEFEKYQALNFRWSTGRRKSLPIGSRLFLIRLGEEPRGLIGSGWSTSEPYSSEGRTFVDLTFDALFTYPAISLSDLQRSPLNSFHWAIQGSGVEIPIDTAQQIERMWSVKTGSPIRRSNDGEHYGKYAEGAVKTVTISSFERDQKARRACISHYGTACFICGFDFGLFYGAEFLGFVHVHHLKPLSEIRKSYKVNPIHDLRPVCPNCHAVIHSARPPLSLEQVKALVSRARQLKKHRAKS
jgi:5-methylcytosine-specific restriction enzyme A